jgi:uncharacterized protein (TIGR01244 family)
MADIRQVSERFAVAPQLSVEDVAEAARLGYRHLVNNRPDGESPGQPLSVEIEAAAAAAGMTYRHAPFQGPPSPDAVEILAQIIEENPEPVLAFCRSGTRSITTWAVVEAAIGSRDPDQILAAAAAAGYDLGPMKDLLQDVATR